MSDTLSFDDVLKLYQKFPVNQINLPTAEVAKGISAIKQITEAKIPTDLSTLTGISDVAGTFNQFSSLFKEAQSISGLLSGTTDPIQIIGALTKAAGIVGKIQQYMKDPIGAKSFTNDSTNIKKDEKTGYLYKEDEQREKKLTGGTSDGKDSNASTTTDSKGGTSSPAQGNFVPGRYYGKNQQCASLTKHFCPWVGAASTWSKGTKVKGSSIPKGTPIATFNFGNNYGPPGSPGGASGVSHTGI